MARIRFYLDEHVATAVARGLRRRGIDVLTVVEAGLLGASDETHLARALAESRALFSHDVDFLRLHASGAQHAGIVFARQGTGVGRIIQGLLLIHQLLGSEGAGRVPLS